MRRLLTMLLTHTAALCLLWSSSLLAATTTDKTTPQWYQIEVLIYQHLTHKSVISEQWPLLDPNNIDIKTANIPNITSITSLPLDQLVLTKLGKRLTRHPDYQIILHAAWLASAKDLQSTKTFHLLGGQLYTSDGEAITPTPIAGAFPLTPNLHWQLNGTLSIHLKRYFNIDLNLLFAEPTDTLSELADDDQFSAINTGLMYFHLKQMRRMRSDELDYIDYPLYGILIKIIPASTPMTDVTASLPPPAVQSADSPPAQSYNGQD